ncbi:BatA domain-containing protein [Algoriphagus sp. AGSA1]|uniref:BatA domain-containing protein n=1 Tax=Algoriphagus sp. AGSA1 TaxID=2907213 RepID=UPI001F22114C|nr:BatA domain-containing protein [Algoriphagus sp. AGSA1]MCE7057293.1 BatA domain-containing protein [Algoriphagus sp. AGSA1]
MQILQPILLWGMLGISIPILVHLWRGKKGREMSWAAMHWLPIHESSVSKGFQLDNILVLLLRMAILLLLVLLLSKVFVPKLDKVSPGRSIHLVEPSKEILEEFRFEIQQAMENGEEVYWADGKMNKMEDLKRLEPIANEFSLQASLDKLPEDISSLNLYMGNSLIRLGTGKYLSKIKPDLLMGNPDLAEQSNPLLTSPNGVSFQRNDRGILDTVSVGKKSGGRSIQLKDEDLRYYLGEILPSERVYVKAGLEAIGDVYGVEFQETEDIGQAALIFDSDIPSETSSDKLYFIRNSFSFSDQANMVFIQDTLDFEHSELVQKGMLPEVILEKFLDFSGLEKQDVQMSRAQVERRFVVDTEREKMKKANLDLLFLILLVLCLGLERYFSHRQKV